MAWTFKKQHVKWIPMVLIFSAALTFICFRYAKHVNDIKELSRAIGDVGTLYEAVNESEKKYAQLENKIKELQTQHENGRNLSGFTDVEGKGIIITLSDSNGTDINNTRPGHFIIHDSDIMNILNELINAGSEAISINGERIITTSRIKSGGPVIIINGGKHSSPFVIKAIGGPDALELKLKKKGNTLHLLERDNIGVEITKSERVAVPRYTGNMDFQYAHTAGTD